MPVEPFLAHVGLFPFQFAPRNWAHCDGQLIPIAQNTALFSLVGTMYGGDGKTTFALPDLRGRSPMHRGQGPGLASRDQGSTGGEAAVALNASELPAHSHTLRASSSEATTNRPGGAVHAQGGAYGTADGAFMHAETVGMAGGGQPHENRPPFLALSFCIALQGVFPPRG